MSCCCCAVGVSRVAYPLPSGWLDCISTPWKARYWLVYEAPWKDSVCVSGYTSVLDEWVCPRLLNVPKRDSATTTAHRSAAQYGQYSAPRYTTSGLPPSVSTACPLVAVGRVDTFPAPIWSSVAAGTPVTAATTAASAGAALAGVP